ncbi:hypothetical protein VIGAN_06054700, partial [Vigna angularis var. angularis]
ELVRLSSFGLCVEGRFYLHCSSSLVEGKCRFLLPVRWSKEAFFRFVRRMKNDNIKNTNREPELEFDMSSDDQDLAQQVKLSPTFHQALTSFHATFHFSHC